MKRFKYSLENVLHYKEQILDSIKAEHGTLLAQIRKKEAEIQELELSLIHIYPGQLMDETEPDYAHHCKC